MKLKKILKHSSSVLVLILLGWYIYKNRELYQSIPQLSYHHLLSIAILEILLTTTSAIVNWKIISSIDPRVTYKVSWYLQSANNLFNRFIPKAGAGYRGIYLKKVYDFPYSKFISTVAGLYIISFLTYSIVGVIMVGVIWLQYQVFSAIILIGFLTIITGCVYLIINESTIKAPKNRIFRIINTVLQGWHKIKTNKRFLIQVSLLTCLIILLSSLQLQTVYSGINQPIGFINATYLSVISLFTVFIDITPQSIGIKEALFAYSQAIVGLDASFLIYGSIVLRVVTLIVSAFTGIISHYILLRTPPNKYDSQT